KAVLQAIAWAERLAQPLTFVTVTDGSEYKYLVWDEPKMAAGNNPVDPPLIAALAKARKAGLTQLSCVRASGPGIAQAIVTYAEKNGYHHIVMGSAGRTGTARFLKGSVAQELVT